MIGLYRGTSLLSRMIRLRTWSEYSHAAWIEQTGSVVEAWKRKGVRYSSDVNTGHTPGTVIDLFDVPLTQEQMDVVRKFLAHQVGKKYDWRGVLHFITKRHEYSRDQERWFCSELIFSAFKAAGVELLSRVEPWKVSPAMLAMSPLLRPCGRLTTAGGNIRRHIRDVARVHRRSRYLTVP